MKSSNYKILYNPQNYSRAAIIIVNAWEMLLLLLLVLAEEFVFIRFFADCSLLNVESGFHLFLLGINFNCYCARSVVCEWILVQ